MPLLIALAANYKLANRVGEMALPKDDASNHAPLSEKFWTGPNNQQTQPSNFSPDALTLMDEKVAELPDKVFTALGQNQDSPPDRITQDQIEALKWLAEFNVEMGGVYAKASKQEMEELKQLKESVDFICNETANVYASQQSAKLLSHGKNKKDDYVKKQLFFGHTRSTEITKSVQQEAKRKKKQGQFKLVAAGVATAAILLATHMHGFMVAAGVGGGIALAGAKNLYDASKLKKDAQKLDSMYSNLAEDILGHAKNDDQAFEIVAGDALQNKIASVAKEATKISSDFQSSLGQTPSRKSTKPS